MLKRIGGWFGLISIILIALFGIGLYISLVTFLISFICGICTILYFTYDEKKVFPIDVNVLSDPLQQFNYNVQVPKVVELFQNKPQLPKYDQRITGSDTVDAFLIEIIDIILNDYVTPWYEILTTDKELTEHSIKKLAVNAGANIANRIKGVDWVQLLSTRFPEELTTHLKIFKQSQVRLKHIQLINNKDLQNGNSRASPKKDDKKTHRRNKSDTDLGWTADMQTYGKSKFYDSAEHLSGKTLKDLFFDMECSLANKQMGRDVFCTDPDKEYALLSEVSECLLYLIAPEEVWKCHALKLILIDLLAGAVFRPLISTLSDPDNINRVIIKSCCRDSVLPSDVFLMVIRCSEDAEELDAILELVRKEIQKLHSKDSAGGCELPVRQQLSSLQYLTQIIHARRAILGPQQDVNDSSNAGKVSQEVTRSLEFLSATTAWRSNAQYLMEIDLIEADSSQTSKAVIENLRSSALEICDTFLSPSKPTILGLPTNCYTELVRKITTDGDDFTSNPIACFDYVQKTIYEALGETQQWQSSFMHDDSESDPDKNIDVNRENSESKKYSVTPDVLPMPGGARHNRSRSDIVGSQKIIHDAGGLTSNSLSLSHSEISQNKNAAHLTASIIETALVQDKKRTFGIYAIAVTRLSNNEKWHIYRRYSDFHDLHCYIKDKWPELGQLPFPAKKTFLNTSRMVLEQRKIMLNSYLQSLTTLAKEARYSALLSEQYLGGFLSPENQSERHTSKIDALLVNSLRAGMRTLKNMPDQFANTVDGVMDGISKVFTSKSGENYSEFKMDSDAQDDADENVALKLFEEVLGIRGLWLRRHLLAPLRTLIADRVHKKIFEFVASLTSPQNVVHYLKNFKLWLTNRNAQSYGERDSATKARTRVAAKVALLAACSDDLKHIVGSDTARRGLLTMFDLFQTQEINRRLLFVLLESILINLFPDYKIQDLFKRVYTTSPRAAKKVNT